MDQTFWQTSVPDAAIGDKSEIIASPDSGDRANYLEMRSICGLQKCVYFRQIC